MLHLVMRTVLSSSHSLALKLLIAFTLNSQFHCFNYRSKIQYLEDLLYLVIKQ